MTTALKALAHLIAALLGQALVMDELDSWRD